MKKLFFALLFTFFLMPVANSTTVHYLSDQELTQSADFIFSGKCIGKQSYWDTEKKRIYTFYKFQVQSKFKGKGEPQIYTFKQWGGEVEGFRYHIAGIATYDENEDAFSFMTPKTNGDFRFTVGLAQGKLKISQDQKTKKRYLVRNTVGLHFRNSKKLGHVEVIPDYEGFEQKIRGYVVEEQNKK